MPKDTAILHTPPAPDRLYRRAPTARTRRVYFNKRAPTARTRRVYFAPRGYPRLHLASSLDSAAASRRGAQAHREQPQQALAHVRVGAAEALRDRADAPQRVVGRAREPRRWGPARATELLQSFHVWVRRVMWLGPGEVRWEQRAEKAHCFALLRSVHDKFAEITAN